MDFIKEIVMNLINQLSLEDLVKLQNNIVQNVTDCTSLEHAAQNYMSTLYETLNESIVLARLFLTIKFADLPNDCQEFVSKLADSSGVSDAINKDTLILSLLGTRGRKPEWNDRRKSTGHIGIPLASSVFVDKIPMISRLLKELGAGLEWIDSHDTQLVAKTVGSISGVFYVHDADTEVDYKKRFIIPAKDFIRENEVKSVIGVGGGYLGNPVFFTTIIFFREHIKKDVAQKFMLQANKFKTATMQLIEDGRLFN